MAGLSIIVEKASWNSLKHFGLSLRRALAEFKNFKTVVNVILILYIFCIGVGYVICILLLFLDIVGGNSYLDGIADLAEEAQEFVLPPLQLINGLLGLFVGISILTDSSPRCCLLRMKGDCLYRWNIRRLRRVKYGNLVEEEKRETCCICLEGIGEEEIVRILPNCKHYLHARCIDQWFLCQSSCPVCRAAVCEES